MFETNFPSWMPLNHHSQAFLDTLHGNVTVSVGALMILIASAEEQEIERRECNRKGNLYFICVIERIQVTRVPYKYFYFDKKSFICISIQVNVNIFPIKKYFYSFFFYSNFLFVKTFIYLH